MIISAGNVGIGFGRAKRREFVLDRFNRANNNVTMGSTETGQLWVPIQGVWGILNNRAYCVTGNVSDIVLVDSVTKDVEIECITRGQLADLSQQRFFNIVFRALDANNFLMTRITGGRLEIYKAVNGTLTVVSSYGVSKNIDDVDYHFKITCKGNSVSVTVDGTFTTSYTLTAGEAAFRDYTKVGLRQTVNGQPIHVPSAENFSVVRI